MCLYKLVFDDFAPWYLEMVKPDYQKPVDSETFSKSVYFLSEILKLLHPFMPFITEEIWQLSEQRDKSIMVTKWPESKNINQDILTTASKAFELISLIRNTRSTNSIAPKKELNLYLLGDKEQYVLFEEYIKKMSFINEFETTSQSIPNTLSFISRGNEFYIPVEIVIDTEKERENLKKEIQYAKGFLDSVNSKLANSNFVDNAPEIVVKGEQKKKKDTELKIKKLEARLGEFD